MLGRGIDVTVDGNGWCFAMCFGMEVCFRLMGMEEGVGEDEAVEERWLVSVEEIRECFRGQPMATDVG